MSIESMPKEVNEAVDLQDLYEQPAYEPIAPADYSNPNSPDLDELLRKNDYDVIKASRWLMDRMISGEIQ